MSRELDAGLVARSLEGDQAAMELLVYRYQRPVFNAAFRLLGDTEEARDVAQVVFMKTFERLESYDPKYRFFSWVYRIAVNESLNRLRHAGREVQDEVAVDAAQASETTDPEAAFSKSETHDRVQAALMSMREDDRVVLTLRHFSDCSYHDIAEILEIPEKTVKSRLYSARQRLLELLPSEGSA